MKGEMRMAGTRDWELTEYRGFEIEDVGDAYEAFPIDEELAWFLEHYDDLTSLVEVYIHDDGSSWPTKVRAKVSDQKKAMEMLKSRIDSFLSAFDRYAKAEREEYEAWKSWKEQEERED